MSRDLWLGTIPKLIVWKKGGNSNFTWKGWESGLVLNGRAVIVRDHGEALVSYP